MKYEYPTCASLRFLQATFGKGDFHENKSDLRIFADFFDGAFGGRDEF